jgi:hypothetical protein
LPNSVHLLVSLSSVLLLAATTGFGQATTPWRFIAVGDTRGTSSSEPLNSVVVGELADQIVKQGAAFVLVPGDLVNQGSLTNFLAWRNAMAPVYQAGIGVYPVLGNHDANDVPGFIEAFGADLPDNGPSGEVNRTYSFIYRNALILALDMYANVGRVNQPWVDSMLTENTVPLVFAFGHLPAFKSSHWDCLDDYPAERDAFWRSLQNAGTAAYFCGHDHYYNHMRVDDGDGHPEEDVHQLIVGGGGAPLYGSYAYDGNNTSWVPVNQFHDNQYGYVVIEIDGLTATFRWYHRSGPATYAPAADVWSYTASPGMIRPTAPNALRAIAASLQE